MPSRLQITTVTGLPTLDVVDVREDGPDAFGGSSWSLTVDTAEPRIRPDIDLHDLVLHFVDGDFDGRGALDGIDRQADGTTHARISVSVDPTS